MENIMTDKELVEATITHLIEQVETSLEGAEENPATAPTTEWLDYMDAMINILDSVKDNEDLTDFAVVCRSLLDVK